MSQTKNLWCKYNGLYESNYRGDSWSMALNYSSTINDRELFLVEFKKMEQLSLYRFVRPRLPSQEKLQIISDWCDENLSLAFCLFVDKIYFECEEDLIAYVLRWRE